MSDKLLSGESIVDAFFAELKNLEGVDEALKEKLTALYASKKFTPKEISNALDGLRRGAAKNG